MYDVVFTEQESRDLADIFDFVLEASGGRNATFLVEAIYEHCLGFDLFPHRGQSWEDISPGLRSVGYRKQATIAFRVEDRTVTILRIFSAGREIRFDPGAF